MSHESNPIHYLSEKDNDKRIYIALCGQEFEFGSQKRTTESWYGVTCKECKEAFN